MKKITIKDMIDGEAKKLQKKGETGNTLFKGDSENITESFNKSEWEYLELLTTDGDNKTGLIKETIIGIKEGEAYLINTTPHLYNGEATISIFSKWLSLNGFNYFTKEMFENSDNAMIDHEGQLTNTAKDYFNSQLILEEIEADYDYVISQGVINTEYKCITYDTDLTDTHNFKLYITINERGQLSKITKKISIPKNATIDKKINIKSILS